MIDTRRENRVIELFVKAHLSRQKSEVGMGMSTGSTVSSSVRSDSY